MTERHIQAIWYDAALRPQRLATCCGRDVRVIDPGTWNLEAGPDFKNAVLEVGPEHLRVVGDVEVHLRPHDWTAHDHGRNAHYRNVVAHVTWASGPRPPSLPSSVISICLARFLFPNKGFSFRQIDLDAYPYSYRRTEVCACGKICTKEKSWVEHILYQMGSQRILLHANDYAYRLRAMHDPIARQQFFYEEVMSSLGYKGNSVQFRNVARQVPIHRYVGRVDALEWALLSAASFETWNPLGCRPCNRPLNRIAHAAKLLSCPEFIELSSESDFSQASCQKMMQFMTKNRAIGYGRAASILANIILPFAIAGKRTDVIPDWLPPEDISAPVRLMAWRLFSRDANPRVWYANNGVAIQGLLHIYKTWCAKVYPNCIKWDIMSGQNVSG